LVFVLNREFVFCKVGSGTLYGVHLEYLDKLYEIVFHKTKKKVHENLYPEMSNFEFN